MPTIKSIQISNFKGATDISLSLAGKIATPVITLIGLNESGKTTILEGLSYFVSKDSAVSKIFEGVHSPSAISSLIPIHKKAAFTGTISVTARIELSDHDVDAAVDAAREHGVEVQPSTISHDLEISQRYKFVDSVNTESSRIWDLKFVGRFKGKRAKNINGTEPAAR